MKVKEAMHKGVTWCAPDTSLADVAKMLRDQDIGAVPIGENDKMIGMVTDRDIVCRGVAAGRDMSSACARDVMTSGIAYCYEDDDMDEAVNKMEEQELRRMPVINSSKRLVGMLSMGDLSHAVSYDRCGEFAQAVSAPH
jgi:CBS domain-containing protein